MKRLLKWGIAIMLVVFGTYFVALGVTTYQRDAVVAELREVYAATSRSGAAGALATIAGPRVDHTRGNSQAFESVFEEYAAYPKNDPKLRPLLEVLRSERPSNWSPDTREQLDALFETHGDLLERLKSALADGGPLRVYDPLESLTASLPHVTYAWELGRLLTARAHVAMGRGEVDAAIDDLLAALTLGELLAPEPATLAQVMRMDLAARVADPFATWVGIVLVPERTKQQGILFAVLSRRRFRVAGAAGESEAAMIPRS